MKELFDSLNLPKQILDKTEKFISTLLGPSVNEMGELFADKIRFKRLKNQVKILKKTIEILENNNLKAKELNLKTLVPLIENSSIEEDEILQNKWANLLANIVSTPESGLEPRLVKTLSSICTFEAKILDYIYDEILIEKNLKYAKYLNHKLINIDYWKSPDDIKNSSIILSFNSVKKNFNLTENFTTIYLDNLVTLGLIKYEDPEIDIDDNSSDADLEEDEELGQKISLDLNLSANFNSSNNFYITEYGDYFINQCKPYEFT